MVKPEGLEMRRQRLVCGLAALAYLATIVCANWLTSAFGLVDAFGLVVTAGTFAAGLSFAARDALQDAAGKSAVVLAIVVGAALSALLSPIQLAIASGVTFLVSEGADMAVYTPLRKRGKTFTGWVASNVVGSLVDSALFLWLAGFPMSGFVDQSVVKVAVSVGTALAVAGLIGVGRVVLRHRLDSAGA